MLINRIRIAILVSTMEIQNDRWCLSGLYRDLKLIVCDTYHYFPTLKPTTNLCLCPPASYHVPTAINTKTHEPVSPIKATLTVEELHRRFHNQPSLFQLENRVRNRPANRTRNKPASARELLSRFLNPAYRRSHGS
jgi:hypothetical protein